MGRLCLRDTLGYIGAGWRGKVAAGFLLLASPAWAEPVTVLALGDSLTQGYGLVEAEGFVPQLSAWLEAAGTPATLINGGVSGQTTAGGAAQVAWSLTPEVDAMIVALGGNDLLRGIAPEEARQNLERIMQEASAQGVEVLLVGLPAPSNYGAAYKAEFDAIYPDLAAEYGAALAPDFFIGLAGEENVRARFFQPDGIHPNAEGVARIVEALGPAVADLIAAARDEAQ